ncbi:hypothetical protein [Longimicrobium sp.]|jgi:poly(3-hydroxybutyrate) depolymerase|uniref:hypothetical protein n=1 Tax=Longimicrobium sp. TaxID=2029185 RepID=UPI002F9514B6
MPDLRVVEASPLRYLLSVPDGAPNGPRPVLCFLHGYDEAAPTEIIEGITRHGPLRPGSDGAATRDMIVVAPQLPAAGDIWRRYADVVRDIVSRVQAEHGGDPARTYLTGFSFGGNGVFDLALCQPGVWAALWPVDPTRVPGGDPGLPVWMSSGEVSRRGEARFIERLSLGPATDPPADRVYVDQGMDHVGTATLAYQDERIYRWLIARRNPPA